MNFDLKTYKQLLGYRESSDSYLTNIGNGAYGKYQFLLPTIKSVARLLNIQEPTVDEFLHNPKMQDRFLEALVYDSLNYLKNNNLEQFIGQVRTGSGNKITTPINIYGLIAGIHLGGAGNMREYLRNNLDKSDHTNTQTGGTYISDYVTSFSEAFNEKKRQMIAGGIIFLMIIKKK